MADDNRLPSRARDLGIILPALGVVLMMPPVIGLFARPDVTIMGIPLIVVYLFGLWFTLILAARSIAKHLCKIRDEDRSV